ncbi:MAG: HAD family hydrolase [Puniceicoccaceae bacterium]
MFKAAIFDWDGVVVDSSAAHKASWELLAEQRGLPLPDNHFALGFGKKNQTIIPSIYKWSQDPDEIEELGFAKEELYRRILKESGLNPALPGAIDLFKELKSAGIPMAVGTSTPRENVDLVIELIGAEGFFGAIISAEDVSHGKPDPEVFLKGAEALGVNPVDCAVFEDAIYGVEAALAGGMKAVCLTTTHPREYFDSVQPHAFVSNLAGVNLQFLQDLYS